MRDYLGRAYGKKNKPRVGYGEIEDIYRRIQKLSGYLNSTIEDIKKIETDPEVQLMYYLFHEHHLLPGDYWRLPAGERVVLRAFFLQDMEQRREHRG